MSGRGENSIGGNDEVCTPREIWEPIVERFGPIGLDPASNERSEVPAATRFMLDTEPYWGETRTGKPVVRYRVKQNPRLDCPHPTIPGAFFVNALEYSWAGHGLVFLNGPWGEYAKPRGLPWVRLPFEEADECINLTKAAVSTQWFQRHLVKGMDATVLWEGRLTFLGEKNPAPFPVALSYHGPRLGLFLETFGKRGIVIK